MSFSYESGGAITTLRVSDRVFQTLYYPSDDFCKRSIDGFGSPAPFLSTSLWAVKIDGLLYLTSTDGRTATGHSPKTSLSVYGAYARAHPAAHEQGLRLLIGAVQQQAGAKGLGIEPVFSLFVNQTYRVMLRLVKRQSLTAQNYGFIGYCNQCGEYQIVSWHKLGRVVCLHDSHPLTLSGPMWLGALHDRNQLKRLQLLAQKWDWLERFKLLQVMEAEVDFPPYFYTLGEIGRRGKMDIPKRDRLIQALQERGYRASPTHIDAQAIKTDADLPTCIAVARCI